MEGNAVLWLILIIGGLTLVYLLIRYVINRGVDKATDAIHNSRVRSKNEQAGSVYNAPVQRNAAVTGSASAISAGSDSSPVLRDGVQYLRDWYPNYRPAHIRHGLQGYASTAAVPTAPKPDPAPVRSVPVSEQPAAQRTAPVEAYRSEPLNRTPAETTPVRSAPAAQPVAATRYGAAKDAAVKTPQRTAEGKQPEEPLRGFLKAIVIIYYVCTGLTPTLGLIAAITMFSSAALLNSFGIGAGFFVFLGVFMLAVCVGVGIVCFRFAKKIVKRDASFLHYYHKAFIVCVLAELLILILMLTVPVYGAPLARYSPSVIGEMIISILQGAAGTIGLTVFFVRSRYVHAYMGSDDYLYQSPFTRRCAKFDAPAKQPVSARTTAPQTAGPAPAQDISFGCCCICSKPLESRYAVLYRSADGTDARVDRICYEALRDLGTSEDPDAVLRAKQYIFGKAEVYRNRALSEYLEPYEQSAVAFLRQSRTAD
ncbi:MAG: hypothetical protein IKP38_06450 [Clostridia bacterium]|nr:hypothetical protein [Clostridia bacterium]